MKNLTLSKTSNHNPATHRSIRDQLVQDLANRTESRHLYFAKLTHETNQAGKDAGLTHEIPGAQFTTLAPAPQKSAGETGRNRTCPSC